MSIANRLHNDASFCTRSFPARLHTLLNDADVEGFAHVISWQQGGQSFRVYKPEMFASTIMQSFFVQSKFKSFQRQLNIYGWRQIQMGPHKGGYAHKFFQQARPDLCDRIQRRKNGSNVTKHPQRQQRQLQEDIAMTRIAPISCSKTSSLSSSSSSPSSSSSSSYSPHMLRRTSLTDLLLAAPLMLTNDEIQQWIANNNNNNNGGNNRHNDNEKRQMDNFFWGTSSDESATSSSFESIFWDDTNDITVADHHGTNCGVVEDAMDAFISRSIHLMDRDDDAILNEFIAHIENTTTTTTTDNGNGNSSCYCSGNDDDTNDNVDKLYASIMKDTDDMIADGLLISNLPLHMQQPQKVIADNHTSTFPTDGSENDYFSVSPVDGEDCSFPIKLHLMLDNAERDGYSHIVSWVKNGRAFQVHDQRSFVQHVMPTYFNQSKYDSFRRQLNLYHFTRIARGTDRGIVSHPLLVQGSRHLCRDIKRHFVQAAASATANGNANVHALFT